MEKVYFKLLVLLRIKKNYLDYCCQMRIADVA